MKINENNLIHKDTMIIPILDKLGEKTIEKLNSIVSEIIFMIGNKYQRHNNEKGYYSSISYEYNCKNKSLTIFLYPIFNEGWGNWNKEIGGLKIHLWKAFYSEFIYILETILQLDLKVLEKAKKHYLNGRWYQIQYEFMGEIETKNHIKERPYLRRLRHSLIPFSPKNSDIDTNKLIYEISKNVRPQYLGYGLEMLYNNQLGKFRKVLNKSKGFDRYILKIIDEFRRLKLKNKYEYRLSELVNYCFNSYHTNTNYFEINEKLQRYFFRKIKEQLLTYFEEDNIKLAKYKDNANRIHLFLSEKTFIQIKESYKDKCEQDLKDNKFVKKKMQKLQVELETLQERRERDQKIREFFKFCDSFINALFARKPLTYKISNLIKIKLINNRTEILIKGKRFMQCKYLLLNIDMKDTKTYKIQKDINSIDEAKELLSNDMETNHFIITPKQEFWGHCSNIQAWYENNYDLRIIHSNLGIPLLQELSKHGDSRAIITAKEYIMKRIEQTGMKAYQMAKNWIDKYFTEEEKQMIKEIIDKKEIGGMTHGK